MDPLKLLDGEDINFPADLRIIKQIILLILDKLVIGLVLLEIHLVLDKLSTQKYLTQLHLHHHA